jgi:hypothetical protein
MSKHISIIDKLTVFSFDKPTSTLQFFNTNPPEFKGIDKLKEVFKKTKPLNKNSKILFFLSENNNNNSFINIKDIYNLANINTPTPTPILKTLSKILVTDSQIKVPDSILSSHSSLIINSTPTSSLPPITIFIVDSNTTTQATTVSFIYSIQKDELYPTPSLTLLVSTPPLSLILIKENSDIPVKVISVSLQKNQ